MEELRIPIKKDLKINLIPGNTYYAYYLWIGNEFSFVRKVRPIIIEYVESLNKSQHLFKCLSNPYKDQVVRISMSGCNPKERSGVFEKIEDCIDNYNNFINENIEALEDYAEKRIKKLSKERIIL